MVKFTNKTLTLMPSNALTGLSNTLVLDKNRKLATKQSANAKLNKLQGTSTLSTPNKGRITVNTGGSKSSLAVQQGMSSSAKSWSNGASVMSSQGANPGNVPTFVPGSVPNDTTQADVDTMTSELNSFFGEEEPSKLSPTAAATMSALTLKINALQNEIDEINRIQGLIEEILRQRSAGNLPEPKLNFSALDIPALPPSYKKIAEEAVAQATEFVENQIVAPFTENQRLLASLTAQVSGVPGITPTFDLEYGPPISAGNKFVLSEDGLYYDSRTEPVPTIVPLPTSASTWQLDFDSNRGGRGVTFDKEDSLDGAGSIFSLETDLGENSPRVLDFYRFDDVLQQFNDDQQAEVTQVSGYITEILANGYTDADALVQSYLGQLGAITSLYSNKIKKRKRQLEIAAIYGRKVFFVTDREHPLGEGIFFRYFPPIGKSFEYNLTYDDLSDNVKSTTFLEGEGGGQFAWNTELNQIEDIPLKANIIARQGIWKEIPRIPINDFSYLKETNVSLPVQKKLTLFSEDLDTIVAPYQARYVIAPTHTPKNFTNDLSIDMIGYGDWVHREGTGSLSATEPLYKALTDDIVSDKLLACYNFLDPDAVTQPSGSLYGLNNAAEGSPRMDAKLVGYDRSFVFPSGVGMAFMGGTLFDTQAQYDDLWTAVYGSYARLPNMTRDYVEYNVPYNGSKALDNLFYSPSGVCFDFWSYVPEIWEGMSKYHRYRLVLANENSGPVETEYVTSKLTRRNTANTVAPNFNRTLGMIMGWRDAGQPGGAGNDINNSPSGLEFIIAPTVSQNQSLQFAPQKDWGHSICIGEKWSGETLAPASGDLTANGLYITSSIRTDAGSGIGEVSGGFMHFNVSFDYYTNQVRVVLDGEHLITSSFTDTLGINPSQFVTPTPAKIKQAGNPAVPIFCNPRTESYLGTSIYDERVTPERVGFPVFTPWIIGGGYSDIIPKIPGLDYRPQGFLGSNTNHTYQGTLAGADVVTETVGNEGDFIIGQHTPPMSGGKGGIAGTRNSIQRSGLDGYVGSFKIYTKPLSTIEAKANFDAQKGFFKNVLI